MENSSENQKSSIDNNKSSNPGETGRNKNEDALSGIRGGGTDINALKSGNNSKEINSAGDVAALNDEMKDRHFDSHRDGNNPADSNMEPNFEEENLNSTTQSTDNGFGPSDWPVGHVNEEGGFGDERSSEDAGNGSSVGNP